MTELCAVAGRQQADSSGAWQCSDRTLCSATPSIQEEDREKGLSCSVGRPSRGCLAQLVGDLGTYKGLVGGERGEGRNSAHKGSEGPRTCISSHGGTAAMSQSGNKQRSMHEAQKSDSLSNIFLS